MHVAKMWQLYVLGHLVGLVSKWRVTPSLNLRKSISSTLSLGGAQVPETTEAGVIYSPEESYSMIEKYLIACSAKVCFIQTHKNGYFAYWFFYFYDM